MSQPNNPLHGKTLEAILNELVARIGWAEMGYRIRINCFIKDPNIKSSLAFLRKTEWARKKVEELYLDTIAKKLKVMPNLFRHPILCSRKTRKLGLEYMARGVPK